MAFWKFTVPWGPLGVSPPPPLHARLVHLVAIILFEGGGGVGLGLWKSPKTKGQVSSRIPLQNDFFRVAFTGQNL